MRARYTYYRWEVEAVKAVGGELTGEASEGLRDGLKKGMIGLDSGRGK